MLDKYIEFLRLSKPYRIKIPQILIKYPILLIKSDIFRSKQYSEAIGQTRAIPNSSHFCNKLTKTVLPNQ
jgi:hypothetical protein